MPVLKAEPLLIVFQIASVNLVAHHFAPLMPINYVFVIDNVWVTVSVLEGHAVSINIERIDF